MRCVAVTGVHRLLGWTVLWACLIFFLGDDTRLVANVIAAQVAFVPPAIIFAIGAMLAWAFGRFSHQK